MPVELLATCWTHAGDSMPVAGRRLSPLDLRARAEAVAAAGLHRDRLHHRRSRRRPLLPPGGEADLRRPRPGPPRGRAARGLVDHRQPPSGVGPDPGVAADGSRGSRRATGQDRTRRRGRRRHRPAPGRRLPLGGASCTAWPSGPQTSGPGWRWSRCRSPTSPTSRLAATLVAAADHPAAGLVVDIWHLERGPSTLADLAEIPGDKVFVVELSDAPAPQSTDLFHDTIHHRVLCGAGTFDVKGFIATLQQIGFAGPWSVEIISDAHRRRPVAGGTGGRAPYDDGAVRQPGGRRAGPARLVAGSDVDVDLPSRSWGLPRGRFRPAALRRGPIAIRLHRLGDAAAGSVGPGVGYGVRPSGRPDADAVSPPGPWDECSTRRGDPRCTGCCWCARRTTSRR